MATKHPQRMVQSGRQLARKLIRLQSITAAVLVFIFGIWMGTAALMTALAGAVIAIIPNIVFAAFAFRHAGARSAPAVVHSFYAGEGIKLFLTMIMFVIAFVTLNGPWLPLFTVFAILTFMHWLAPILHLKLTKLGY